MARRLLIWMALLAGTTALSGCSSSDGQKVSVDAVRKAAAEDKPVNCPVDFDLPGALRSGGVDRPVALSSASAEVSKTEMPAADSMTAQQNGMSPLDAAAGAFLECDYRIGDDTLTIRVTATRAQAAIALLAPQIQRDARLAASELQPFFDSRPGPGEVKIAGGSVAVAGLAADGGDAALMVSSEVPELRDETLRKVTGELLGQVKF
jgi:hypothetical protein